MKTHNTAWLLRSNMLRGLQLKRAPQLESRRRKHHVQAFNVTQPAWGRQSDPVAVYVHLPFCKRKCFYCDFPVVAVGLDTERQVVGERFTSYVGTLCKEISSHVRLNTQPLQSVYFGGGTPSLLPPHLLDHILQTLRNTFEIDASAEVTMEADPGTFDSRKLQEYMAAGVTRFSIGVQAFDEELLEACGRAHTLEQVYMAVDALKAVQPPSWSMDLISGLPGLKHESWLHSIREVIRIQPNHVSIYDLQIEDGTPFDRWHRTGQIRVPPEDSAVEMFETASRELQAAGFEHYELSNYAQPGHRSRHNQVYWRGYGYYAFGVGAASYLQGQRFSRPATMAAYTAYVAEAEQKHVVGGFIAGAHGEGHSTQDAMLECLMLQLRLNDGVPLRWFRDTFGADKLQRLLTAIKPHLDTGRAVLRPVSARTKQPLVPREDLQLSECVALLDATMLDEPQKADLDCALMLADPHGLVISNSIISDLFVALDS